MNETAYTLATYRVKPGLEDDFVRVWNELADTFVSLPNPPIWGTLIRSNSDPGLFHSFGPWSDAEHIREMRSNESAGAMFAKLRDLCTELTAGDYEMITHVNVAERRNSNNLDG